MSYFTDEQRASIATILETVARDGLPGPRDLDVALDAIECTIRDDDLIHRLEASRLWWMIGKGKARKGEPPYGCLLQQPVVDGSMVAKAEGDNMRECVGRALAQVPHDERPTDPHHGGKVSP